MKAIHGALILGLLTSVETDVLAQEKGDFSAPGSFEAIDKAPLISQGSPETSPGIVTGEEKSESFVLNNDIINHIKQQCDRRDPKVANESINRACTAVGCQWTTTATPCSVE